MSASTRLPTARATRAWTATERNWLLALGLVVGSIALAAIIQQIEIAMGRVHRSERMVGHAVEASMRFLALPHFVIAILFMTTSRGMQSAKAWGWLVVFTAAGVGLCYAFAAVGGRAVAIPNALFLSYFLVHEFRDQAFFYKVNGDSPTGPSAAIMRRDVLKVPVLGLTTILAVFLFGAAFRIGGARRYTEAIFGSLDPTVRGVLGCVALALMIGAIHMTRRSWDRRYEGGALGFIRAQRPLFVVYGGILAVLLLDILLSGRAYAIVTLHVAAWYVFTLHMYRKQSAARAPSATPVATERGAWHWIRRTRQGFGVLHWALVAIVMLLAVLWAYGFDNSPDRAFLWGLLSKDAFPYWTILHVTISFAPK